MHSFVHFVAQWFSVTTISILVYYVAVNLYYTYLHVVALFELRTDMQESAWNPPTQTFSSPFYPDISIIVPAYNEAETIVESVRSLLALNYPEMDIVVVNDGSTDETLERLTEEFALQAVEADIPLDVPSEEIRGVYRSASYDEILVVDKENGGKSDALNAGIWLTDSPLFCAVDSDTIVDQDALLEIVKPFLEQPGTTVASGGVVRVANDCVIEDGLVEEIHIPKTGLAGLQVMEYLRAFYCGRLGLNGLNGLLLISGAFGLFRTDLVREIGGYSHDTITEDFDIVVRLHRHLGEMGEEYSIDFVPEPVARTEVPETRDVLGPQRRRWYRGMVETVVNNRDMLFNRKYGRIGTVVFPLFVFAETIGPLVEGLGYMLIPVAVGLGILDVELMVFYFLLTTGVGVFLSWFGVFSEVWSFNRYDSPWQVLRLLWYGVLENFGFRQWKTLVAWQGLFEYARGVDSWGVMERSGFDEDEK